MASNQPNMLDRLTTIQWLPYYILKLYREHLQSHALLTSINESRVQIYRFEHMSDKDYFTFEFRRQGFIIVANRHTKNLSTGKKSNDTAYISVFSFRDNLL